MARCPTRDFESNESLKTPAIACPLRGCARKCDREL
jgi:hypothetical protein